jgi:hypothetical protein
MPEKYDLIVIGGGRQREQRGQLQIDARRIVGCAEGLDDRNEIFKVCHVFGVTCFAWHICISSQILECKESFHLYMSENGKTSQEIFRVSVDYRGF